MGMGMKICLEQIEYKKAVGGHFRDYINMPMASDCLYSFCILWTPPSGELALELQTAPLRSWGCEEPKSLATNQQVLLCGLSGQGPSLQLSTQVTIFAENTLNAASLSLRLEDPAN